MLTSDRRNDAIGQIVGLEVLLEAHDGRVTPGEASQRENQGRTTVNKIQQEIADSRRGEVVLSCCFPRDPDNRTPHNRRTKVKQGFRYVRVKKPRDLHG